MSRNAPPKKQLLTTEPHSFPFVFAVCLHSVEQTNHIVAKCEWRKISRKKACGANNEGFLRFPAFVSGGTQATKNGLCSRATILTEEKNVNESPKYKCFMCPLLCQLNKRIYIFWKCLIEGLHAKRAYIGFLADFHILQDQAIFWQTDLFDMKSIGQ